MRLLIEILIGLSIATSIFFAVSLGRPSNSSNPPLAWLVSGWWWITIIFDTMLLMTLFRVSIPIWLVVAVLFMRLAIWGGWVVMLYRTRGVRLVSETQGEGQG